MFLSICEVYTCQRDDYSNVELAEIMLVRKCYPCHVTIRSCKSDYLQTPCYAFDAPDIARERKKSLLNCFAGIVIPNRKSGVNNV